MTSRFYKDGSFGFRIERFSCVVAETKYAYGTRTWLKFEYLTPLPFSRSLTDPSLLRRTNTVDRRPFSMLGDGGTVDSELDDAADAPRARRWRGRGFTRGACPPVPPPDRRSATHPDFQCPRRRRPSSC